MAQEFSYQLTRFCFGTGIRNNEVPWTKLLQDDLHLIIRTDSQPDGKFSFRVVRQMEVLEALEADKYIDAAILSRRSLMARAEAIYPSQLPIHGVVGDANLAFRWTLASGESRRIQMTFRSRDACFEVARMFQQRGLELKEQRPSSSCPSTARRSFVASDLERTNVSSSLYERPLMSDQLRYQRDKSIGLQSLQDTSCLASGITPRFQNDPAVYVSGDRRIQEDGEMDTLIHTQQAPQARSNTIRPCTSEIWNQPQTISTQPPQSLYAHNTDSNAVLRRSASSLQKYGHNIHSEHERASMNSMAARSQSNSSASHSGRHASELVVSARPTTARTSTVLTSAPAEIDFGVLPGSQCDSSARPSSGSSRPGTGSLELPALPKPKLKRDTSVLRRPSQRENLERRPVIAESHGKRSSDEAFGRTKTSEDAFRPTISSIANSDSALASHDPIDCTSRNVSPGPTGESTRLDRVDDAEHVHNLPVPKIAKVGNQEDVSHFASNKAPTDAPRSNGHSRSNLVPNTGHGSYLSLEEIARMHFENRRTMLDQFFISKLEDEGFKCLCESVADSWRRLGLGL